MSQICTTIEQSKRLKEAGVKKESADMMWEQHYDFPPYLTIPPRTTLGRSIGAHAICAWSLSALWDLLADSNITLEYATNRSSDALIESLVTAIERFAKQGRM